MGPQNIRCNSIAPGAILTPRVKELGNEASTARMSSISPLNRSGKTSDIASAILFLTSDMSSFITGQTIVCDGGATAMDPYR